MKVAIDVSPLKTGHKVRGIGSYTQNLIKEFKIGKWQGMEFEYFASPASPPPVELIHHPYFDFFFHTLPVKKNIGRVVTIHDVIPLVFPEHFPVGLKGNINLFLQKLALKNIDGVICDSKTSEQDIIDKLSVPKEKVHIVYLAPSSVFGPINEQKHLSQVAGEYNLPKSFVLYVGDVNWSKNILSLLEAIKKAKVNLVMVGKAFTDKSLKEVQEIDDLIHKLKLSERIIKTGYIRDEDLAAIYNLASATVLPSFYEGFGLPVLESMACGTPVVCSNIASLAEIGKEAAIFCDPTNPNDIAEKIEYVLGLEVKEKESFSRRLIKHANNFSWHEVAKQTIEVYKLLSN